MREVVHNSDCKLQVQGFNLGYYDIHVTLSVVRLTWPGS